MHKYLSIAEYSCSITRKGGVKIQIDQIPEQGLTLTETCQPVSLDLERADIKFSEPINLSAQVNKGINNISLQLKINAVMHLNCSRCLEEFSSPLSGEIKLNFPIEGKEEIDLTSNLREEIILRYPLKPLCRPDCLGLCATCGRNLNKGRCNHGSAKKTPLKNPAR